MSDVKNKNAATEDEVGIVHQLVTKGFNMKLVHQIKQSKRKHKKGKKKGKLKGNPDVDINTNDLAAAARWCTYNKSLARTPDDGKMQDNYDELQALRERNRSRELKAVGD